MTRPARLLLRSGLVLLAMLQTTLGIWMLLAPRAFYNDVPTVSDYPPYNEHLISDLGALYLALAIPLAIGAVTLARPTVVPALAAYAVFAALHLTFHASHADPTAGSVALDAGLAALLILVLTLLALRLSQRSSRAEDTPVRP
jgi:hypothetical protein